MKPLVGSVFTAASSSELDRATLLSRKGLPVYDYLLAFAVALVVFETFFATRITPDRDARRRHAAGGESGREHPTRSTSALRLE
ncbi:MAG TPA: hypothetical protein ENN09_05430 [Planctomycetes bacterium]|nr:hypothetical protein [Planctomycetota bacterium]